MPFLGQGELIPSVTPATGSPFGDGFSTKNVRDDRQANSLAMVACDSGVACLVGARAN